MPPLVNPKPRDRLSLLVCIVGSSLVYTQLDMLSASVWNRPYKFYSSFSFCFLLLNIYKAILSSVYWLVVTGSKICSVSQILYAPWSSDTWDISPEVQIPWVYPLKFRYLGYTPRSSDTLGISPEVQIPWVYARRFRYLEYTPGSSVTFGIPPEVQIP